VTDGQSINKSCCRTPSGAHDQIFIKLLQLRACFCGPPSLTIGRVSLLYMLLVLASVVLLESESRGTRDHILLSQIWDIPCIASYDSHGHGERIRPRFHTGGIEFPFTYFRVSSARTTHRKHSLCIVVWHHRACAICIETKKTLLQYCWPYRGRYLAMDLHVLFSCA
jgi:hypothetical protein